MGRKRIYRFETGKAEGRAQWRELLGGKGANLAEMANMGIPIPPGFTITTQTCTQYMEQGRLPDGLLEEVHEAMRWLEQTTGKRFGSGDNPLLVSVRSGARASMPGMMDTILDLGLNRHGLDALAKDGRERFSLDAYRRLLTMFGDVVLDMDRSLFEPALGVARETYARAHGLPVPADREQLARAVPDTVLEPDQLDAVVRAYEALLQQHRPDGFPADPFAQLELAIEAVFRSWNTPRAQLYRSLNGIPEDWGTAVNVQAMVFGNLGEQSGTGVAFTRDPSTGQRRFFGEWLENAQGEDVVAGIRTPQPLARTEDSAGGSLEEAMPERFAQLVEIQHTLEQHFRDMQDLEFTIEQGKLYLLQTRNGKRSARASVRIAVEMVDEGILHPDEAIVRIDPNRLQDLLFPAVDPHADKQPIARGLPASPGAVCGQAVFSAAEAQRKAAENITTVLVRVETSPEDLHGMQAASGILTARGGATSHAAVVARGMGRACVAGCASIAIDAEQGTMEAFGPDGSVSARLSEGELITIDGSTGHVYLGSVPTVEAALDEHMRRLLDWTEHARRLGVRANADTPEQARRALAFGAEGIGLCRTEHMFFDDERIEAVRELILASDEPARVQAANKLLPHQQSDFEALFEIMDGRPVTIRLLDPPLHEFLPTEPERIVELAQAMELPSEEVKRRVEELSESNPMLGHRGVRLAISYPEIPRMQVTAILTAACRVQARGVAVHPEIMVPLSLSAAELRVLRSLVDEVKDQVFAAERCDVAFKFGTMIELPRAALLADQLAQHAEFFSFGTNDLTQTTLGLSRDDAGRFLHSYVKRGILPDNPFVTLDVEGVGQLVRMACERGKASRSELSLGLCGEHGGEPRSIEHCERLQLDYVSCSPFRVPIARVAAAQAALKRKGGLL